MITEMIYLFSGCWSSICQLCWWPESRRDRNAAVLCPIFTDFTTTLVPCQSAKCTTPRGSVWLVRNAQRGYIHLLHKNITVTFTYVRKHGILKYNMDGYVSMCVYFDIYIYTVYMRIILRLKNVCTPALSQPRFSSRCWPVLSATSASASMHHWHHDLTWWSFGRSNQFVIFSGMDVVF